jgi:hypothetical protein
MFGGIKKRGDINSAYDVLAIAERVLVKAKAIVEEMFFDEMRVAEESSFERVDDLIDRFMAKGRESAGLDQEELERLLRIGPNRMLAKVPPGYNDFDRKVSRERPLVDALGDLVLWEELVRFAGNVARPLILVTAEEKDDWWQRISGDVVPHHLLVKEMFERAGQRYGSLRLADFVALVEGRKEAELLIEFESSRLLPIHDVARVFSFSMSLGVSHLEDVQMLALASPYTDMIRQAQLGLSNAEWLERMGITAKLQPILDTLSKSVFAGIGRYDMPALTSPYTDMVRQAQLGLSNAEWLDRMGISTKLQPIADTLSKSIFAEIGRFDMPALTSPYRDMIRQAQLGLSNAEWLERMGISTKLQPIVDTLSKSVFAGIGRGDIPALTSPYTDMIRQAQLGLSNAEWLERMGIAAKLQPIVDTLSKSVFAGIGRYDMPALTSPYTDMVRQAQLGSSNAEWLERMGITAKLQPIAESLVNMASSELFKSAIPSQTGEKLAKPSRPKRSNRKRRKLGTKKKRRKTL